MCAGKPTARWISPSQQTKHSENLATPSTPMNPCYVVAEYSRWLYITHTLSVLLLTFSGYSLAMNTTDCHRRLSATDDKIQNCKMSVN